MTAWVDRVSETPRQAGAARQVFDMFLADDSKSGDKTLDLKVSLRKLPLWEWREHFPTEKGQCRQQNEYLRHSLVADSG